jgi:hypothetical protein
MTASLVCVVQAGAAMRLPGFGRIVVLPGLEINIAENLSNVSTGKLVPNFCLRLPMLSLIRLLSRKLRANFLHSGALLDHRQHHRILHG